MGLFVHIAFTMEVWFHLLPPHEYICLALGQQPESLRVPWNLYI